MNVTKDDVRKWLGPDPAVLRRNMWQRLKTPGYVLLGAVIAFMAYTVVFHTKASAQDKSWTGCHAGVFGGYVVGSAMQDGSPFGVSSNGQSAGFVGGCDMQFDKMVVGGEVSYAWMFGNLSDIGVDNDLTITGRAGYLISSDTLLYGHGGWTRVSGSGFDIDGYKAGIGGEFRLPGSAMFLDARWTHAWMNESDIGAPSALNIASDEFRLGLKIKFGVGAEAAAAPAAKKKLVP